MRRLGATVFLWLSLGVIGALAFGTEGGLNGLGHEHQRITRAALESFGPATLDALAGTATTTGAVGEPDQARGGQRNNAALHCHGADYLAPDGSAAYAQTRQDADAALAACRALIVQELDRAIVSASQLGKAGPQDALLDCRFDGTPASAKCDVLEHLGRALHTAQDFYAHTNWVDQPAAGPTTRDNPPGLGHSGRAPWLDPRSETPVPDGLISGCPEDWQVMGNAVGCDYGDWAPFFGQTRVMHTDLNKDNGPVGRASGGTGTTRRGMINGNFARAVGAAIEDTRDKWAYFKERLVQTYGEGPAADIVCVLERDAFDPAACEAQGQQAKLCSARESADAGKDPSVQQLSADEIATAEALWPDLHLSCRTEESDLARQAVLAGGQADQGRARGKVAAIGLLALWNACPAQAARRQASLTGTTPSASRTDALTSAYAGCILAARLHQLQK